jgi:hypothetical protein
MDGFRSFPPSWCIGVAPSPATSPLNSRRNSTSSSFVEQNDGSDQFINSVTGKALRPMHFHNTVLVDAIAHEGTTSGIIFRVVVPGAGAVLLDVGRITAKRTGEIIFEAGPHQFFDGDLAGVCAALQ